MYWDVVEVKAEPDHRLFVRFADGTSGKVQLALSELSGVLAPLRNPSFFERVFVDHGAVAWPGISISRRTRCMSRLFSRGVRRSFWDQTNLPSLRSRVQRGTDASREAVRRCAS